MPEAAQQQQRRLSGLAAATGTPAKKSASKRQTPAKSGLLESKRGTPKPAATPKSGLKSGGLKAAPKGTTPRSAAAARSASASAVAARAPMADATNS